MDMISEFAMEKNCTKEVARIFLIKAKWKYQTAMDAYK